MLCSNAFSHSLLSDFTEREYYNQGRKASFHQFSLVEYWIVVNSFLLFLGIEETNICLSKNTNVLWVLRF